jgi:hypothetical protein
MGEKTKPVFADGFVRSLIRFEAQVSVRKNPKLSKNTVLGL